MHKFKYIKNITESEINFCDTIINSGEEIEFSTKFESLKFYEFVKNCVNNNIVIILDENWQEIDKYSFNIQWENFFMRFIISNGKSFKIYRFLNEDVLSDRDDFTVVPKSIDYIKDLSTRLQKKITFNKGFLTRCEYFEKVEINEIGELIYKNPVLLVEVEYIIGNDGYVCFRNTKRSWQLEDGTYHENFKKTTKYYDKLNAIEEGKRRRNNIITELIKNVVGLIMMTNIIPLTVEEAQNIAMPFLDKNDGEVNKFLKGNIYPLLESITSDISNEFLNNKITFLGDITIKQYILSKLSEASFSGGGGIVK